jgi:alpha-tubulin suppressor-like RCC1 family protein
MPRLECSPAARALRPTRRGGWGPLTHRCAFTLAGLLIAVLGCREDAESPTSPEATPLATSAAQALAFHQVSVGRLHTCGVTTDNRAYCWGYNVYGGLGDGTTTQRLAPVAVAGALRFRQVSAGIYHTCGVTTDYRAYCWGFYGLGSITQVALGDGSTDGSRTPVPVAGGHRFREVDVGEEHTCGVGYPDNRAYCWGFNDEGELGDSTTTKRLTPVAVSGGHQFRQVSAGVDHTCGVTTADEAFCWGANRYGQIGDSLAPTYRLTPSRVVGKHRFHQVDAGARFTCAVTLTDRAYCWGNGRDGQIGDGKLYLRFWPRAVAGGLFFDRVTTGDFHACGETTGNRAYCWGRNSTGALGDGTTTRRTTPVAVVGGHFFRQVSAGGSHTCGKTSADVAYCWGWNFFGQLGDGTKIDRPTPVPVAGPM